MLCRFHGSARGCRYGNNCRFSHDNQYSVPLCRYYSSTQGCIYGNNCQYRHEISHYPSYNFQNIAVCNYCRAINNIGFICCKSCFMRRDILTEPWQITFSLIHLFNIFSDTISNASHVSAAEEAAIGQEIVSMNTGMTHLRGKVSELLAGYNNLTDILNETDDADIRHRFGSIQEQLQQIDQAQNTLYEKFQILNNIETWNTSLTQKHNQRFRINENIVINDYNQCGIFKNAKYMIECLVFGYIYQYIEKTNNLMIPTEIKAVCFIYFGYIIMDSSILNINQIFKIQSMLQMLDLDEDKSVHFYAQKIFDSKLDGFDQISFSQKCNNYANTVCIIKSNYEHILVTVMLNSYADIGNALKLYNGKNSGDKSPVYSFLLQSNYIIQPYGIWKYGPLYQIFLADLCGEFDISSLKDLFRSNLDKQMVFPDKEKFHEYDNLQIVDYEVFYL